MPAGADVVIESSGVPGSAARAFALAARGGTVLLVGLTKAPQPLALADVVLREVDVRTTVAHVCATDLPAALALLTTRPLASTLVDRVVDLEDVVADGLAPMAEGSVHGKVLVSLAMAEVAVLGTGRMGSAMARRVAAAGHRVTVWNRTRAAAEALVARAGTGPGSRRGDAIRRRRRGGRRALDARRTAT